MVDESVLFIGDSSRWSYLVADCLAGVFHNVEAVFWDYGGAPPPASVLSWKGDRVFTFKADLILTPSLLAAAKKSAINFHPSIPDYRGVGGYNYAIADRRPVFGAMCHHMVEEIDFGPIIKVLRFPVMPGESVGSLRERTASYCLILFYEMVHIIASGQNLPRAEDEQWGRRLHTRKMLEQHEAIEAEKSQLLKISA